MNEDLRSDYADTMSTVFTKSGAMAVIGPYKEMYQGPFAESEKVLTNKNKREFFHNEQKGFSIEYTGKTKRNEYQIRSYYNTLTKHSNLINDRVLPNGNVSVYMVNQVSPMYGIKIPIMGFNYDGMYPKTDYDYAKYNTWVTEAKNTMYIGDHHNLTFGGEYRSLEYEGTRLGEPSESDVKNVASRDVRSYAGYVEDLWQVNDKLLLVPSVRLEHNNQFGSEATPKIGMTYAINNSWRFKANYGKGYKAPSISELYMRMHRAMGEMTVDVYGNPDLQPEEAISYDFSIEADKGNNFGKLTYFNNKVTNLITIEALDEDGLKNRYINIGKAQINGVEAELGRHLGTRWTVKMTHNFLDAKNSITDKRLNNRAKSTSTLQLIYDDHKPTGISAVLWDEFARDYRYNDKDYTYNTVNFSINKKWSADFSTYAGLDNIFDKKVDDLFIDGRMWRVGAEWKL